MGNVVLIPRPLPLPICTEYPPQRGILKVSLFGERVEIIFIGSFFFLFCFFGEGFPCPASWDADPDHCRCCSPLWESPALLQFPTAGFGNGAAWRLRAQHPPSCGVFPAPSCFIFRLSSGMLPPRASRGKARLFLQLSLNLEHL